MNKCTSANIGRGARMWGSHWLPPFSWVSVSVFPLTFSLELSVSQSSVSWSSSSPFFHQTSSLDGTCMYRLQNKQSYSLLDTWHCLVISFDNSFIQDQNENCWILPIIWTKYAFSFEFPTERALSIFTFKELNHEIIEKLQLFHSFCFF